MHRLVALGVLAALLAGCAPDAGPRAGSDQAGAEIESGAALYARYCASCHGDGGRGATAAGAGAGPRPVPPDLTTIAARAGGTFPIVAVMSRIDGYAQGQGGMPAFGALLEGETVLLQTEPGEAIPTPERLVRLAEHLASLQRK